jgi:hypothetical protein
MILGNPEEYEHFLYHRLYNINKLHIELIIIASRRKPGHLFLNKRVNEVKGAKTADLFLANLFVAKRVVFETINILNSRVNPNALL